MGGEGRTLVGYAKFCSDYLGEAAGRVCERKIICTFFGCYFARLFLGGSRGLESEPCGIIRCM